MLAKCNYSSFVKIGREVGFVPRVNLIEDIKSVHQSLTRDVIC